MMESSLASPNPVKRLRLAEGQSPPFLATPLSAPKEKKETCISDLPAETMERVFAMVDGGTLAASRLVCFQWYAIIDNPKAPYHIFPKVHYESLTVWMDRGLRVALEKPEADVRPGQKQERESLERSVSGSTRKLKDRLSTSEMPFLRNYFRHITADQLIIQNLRGQPLLGMLEVFKCFCLSTTSLMFDFCNFDGIKHLQLTDFLAPRRGQLREVHLASCSNLGHCCTPAQFWDAIGGKLDEPNPTFGLKGHTSNSWMDTFAAYLLELPNPPRHLDFEGLHLAADKILGRICSWYAADPQLNALCASTLSTLYDPAKVNVGAEWKRNYGVTIENCTGISLLQLHSDILHMIIGPLDLPRFFRPARACVRFHSGGIIEPCFDGQLRRYRTMERVALTCPDGREFVLRVQKWDTLS